MAIDIRLIGDKDEFLAVLQTLHDNPRIRVVQTSGARPTSHDEGVRVYATVEVRRNDEPSRPSTTVTETPQEWSRPRRTTSLERRRGTRQLS